MKEEELKQRLDDIDERLNKIQKLLEKGYVQNLYEYAQTIMNELRAIRDRL